MTLSATISIRVTTQGVDAATQFSRVADLGIEPVNTTRLPLASVSADWAKTDANTGTATMAAGHTIATGKAVAWWEGGCRFDLDATVAGNSVALDGGSGDNFPASDTEMTIANAITIPEDFDGDDLEVLVAKGTGPTHIAFVDSGGGIVKAVDLAAGEPFVVLAGIGLANPLSGNAIAAVQVANGAATANAFVMAGLQNAITVPTAATTTTTTTTTTTATP